MEDGVDAESVGMLFGEAHAVVADAQAQFAGLSLEFFTSPSPVSAKRCSAVRMRIAVSRSIRRTSA
jgi:hypothetical protein